MLFSLGAFVVLMLLVSKFALRPMLAMMKKREDHIENQIKTAEQNRAEAEKLMKDQMNELTKARKEAREIIEKAKAQKGVEAEEILKAAESRADRIIEDGISEIQREKEKALESLRDEIGTLSVQLASKIIEKEVKEQSHSQLVSEYLQEIGRKAQ
jgi:F-type H+-transporting ATPase subunit b